MSAIHYLLVKMLCKDVDCTNGHMTWVRGLQVVKAAANGRSWWVWRAGKPQLSFLTDGVFAGPEYARLGPSLQQYIRAATPIFDVPWEEEIFPQTRPSSSLSLKCCCVDSILRPVNSDDEQCETKTKTTS